MTLQKAKSIARHLGLTLRKVCSGDYRVNFRDGNEITAYYTDNLEDAVNTAVEMARNHEGPGAGGDARQAQAATEHRPAHDFCFSLAEDRARGSRTPGEWRQAFTKVCGIICPSRIV